jgi:hypothetical protein
MRRYLLGQLGEPDGQAIEDRILGGAPLFATLEEAEDDLIEDYLEGALAEDDRARFEGHFLASPRRQQSLACAEMLRNRHFQQLEGAEANAEVAAQGGAGGKAPP